jgi:hypothetical protein
MVATLNSKLNRWDHQRFTLVEDFDRAWAFGSSQYVKQYMSLKGIDPLRGRKAPMMSKYQPVIEFNEASYYQSLIGILRWIVELGRVDICCEVSLLSSHLALPRKGHLDAVFHVFGYLDKHHNP